MQISMLENLCLTSLSNQKAIKHDATKHLKKKVIAKNGAF